MAHKNLNICKYEAVRLCDEYGVNARFNLLFGEVCALKSTQYILPIASAIKLGGIKVGSGLAINATTGVLSVTGGGGGGSNSYVSYYTAITDNITVITSTLPAGARVIGLRKGINPLLPANFDITALPVITLIGVALAIDETLFIDYAV